MTTTRPTVVLGFDAMDPGIARQMAEEGRLPAFAPFFKDGAWSTITNPPGLVVGSTWPSFWTGWWPSRHGFYCFRQLEPKSYKVRRYSPLDVAAPSFWSHLSNAGKRVCILDVPLVPLTEPKNGIHIIDWGTHDRMLPFSTWPAEMKHEMHEAVGEYPLQGRCDHYAEREAWDELLRVLLDGIQRKTELSRRLLARGNWDVFASVYGESHCAGHQFWWGHDPQHPRYTPEAGDPMLQVYQALDRALAGVLESVPSDANVLLLLSHGIGNHNGGDHLLFEIITRLEDSYEKKSPLLVYREKGLRWLLRTWQGLRPRDTSPLAHAPRWVDASRRFIRLPNNELYGGVRINLAGREPRGRVQPGSEFEQLIAWIERELLALTDPDHPGRRLVRKVMRTKELYSGDLRDGLPDLLIDWDHSLPINAATSERIGVVRGEYDGVRSGDHRPTGMLLARVPGIAAGRLPHDVQMVDLAPTIASLAGEPMTNVDGIPIPGLAVATTPRAAESARVPS
jgi:predicted AlkP superfamily phosphohydrolase/phosphomutase